MVRLSLILTLLLNLAIGFSIPHEFSRDDFPPGFVFGSGTPAYQVEGAAREDGRTPSIWDTYAHVGKVQGATGDVACDHYHKYKEDVQLMVDTGLDAYRFSISWSRLIPNGRGPSNPKGLQYYNNLIDELVNNGIQPHVTLSNYDLPQALEDEYGGWVSRRIVRIISIFNAEETSHYMRRCASESLEIGFYIGALLTSPMRMSWEVMTWGFSPPQRCSPPFGVNYCSRGNSSSEPYIAAHNILLAHASAARLYKTKYQDKQHGFIGLCIFGWWFVPLTDTEEDSLATQRALEFHIDWFLDPLVFGGYPNTMKQNVGSRLPAFTDNKSKLVKGSFDFMGVIHYGIFHVRDDSKSLKMENRDFYMDAALELIEVQVIYNSSSSEFPINPWGLRGVLEYVKHVYDNPPIYIYENGQRMQRNSTLDDIPRVKYMQAYLGGVIDALRNGSNTRGYFTWVFLDVFELLDGFRSSFGLYYVDLDDPDLKRYPKLSAKCYSVFEGKKH